MSKRVWTLIGAAVLAWGGVAIVISREGWEDEEVAEATRAAGESVREESPFALEPAPDQLPVSVRFREPPAAGVLFDIDSGEVLWQRRPGLRLPPASLTKLMTALIATERHRPRERVPISGRAVRARGSKTGVLPHGKRVPFEPLLQALIMSSANDAALALAEHDAGSIDRFVDRMNLSARFLGLDCSHFATPSGLVDRDNYSCPRDLAALARAALAEPRIARIAQTRSAAPRFPIRGGRLHLANNHYFLHLGVKGLPDARITGLKTGLTEHAGRCYITTVRMDGTHLGVVLLDSPDPLKQVPKLLAAGFATP